MDIHLKDSDISQMPEELRRLFLEWLPGHLENQPQPNASIHLENQPQPNASISQPKRKPTKSAKNPRLRELMDAGFTKPGIPVRVRCTRLLAKTLGRDYINSLEISVKGTIIYDGEEYDKPSPLAVKINGGSLNGWDYIEVKKNDEWVVLKELRDMLRKSNR